MPNFFETVTLSAIFVIIYVGFAHFVADFMLQTNWMASRKSRNWIALFSHVLVYSVAMGTMVGPLLLRDVDQIVLFMIITFVAHFITDAVTSRFTTRFFLAQFDSDTTSDKTKFVLKDKPTFHNHYLVIGFDQYVMHLPQLFLTLYWLASVYHSPCTDFTCAGFKDLPLFFTH